MISKKNSKIIVINMFDIIRKILYFLYQHNKIANKFTIVLNQ